MPGFSGIIPGILTRTFLQGQPGYHSTVGECDHEKQLRPEVLHNPTLGRGISRREMALHPLSRVSYP